jgi:hypothetical protein
MNGQPPRRSKALKRVFAIATLSISAPLSAQTADLPAKVADCNTVTVVGAPCTWPNNNPPGQQKYLGQIDPNGTRTNITEPFPSSPVPVPVRTRTPFYIGGMYSLQSENLDFSPPAPNGLGNYVQNNHVSDGFTLLAKRQWSDLRGLEARAEVIRYDAFIDSLSLNPGENHTESLTIGPNLQHRFGAFAPYFTPQVGYLYQYRSGVKVAAAAGLDLKAGKHLTVRLADMEYGYAAAQFVKPHTNPLHGREKLSTGIYWSF